MESVPTEVLMKILDNLPIRDVFKICQTNKQINDICNDDLFWKGKLFKEFQIDFSDIPKNLSWKNLAILIVTGDIISVPVYYNDWNKSEHIGDLWIIHTDHIKDIINRIYQLLNKINFNFENKF